MLVALTLAAALSGQAAPAPGQTAGQTPGTAPSAATSGAAPSPDCGGLSASVSGGLPMQCVTAPLEQIGSMALAYAAEARRHGWVVVRGDNNVLWMQKPEASGTCERMTVIIFWDTTAHPEPVAGVPGYIGVITQAGQTCEPLPNAATAQ